MKIEISVPNFQTLANIIGKQIAVAATEAMRETTPEAKQELLDQVVGAGLGTRLANTWRGDTYPESGEAMNPAGYIYSKAPEIIDSFVRGATIAPVNGSKYLWIPTKNVPLARGRVGLNGRNIKGGAMTPQEVENQFNTDFVIRPGQDGHLLAFIDVVKSLNGKMWRRATKGRLRQGRFSEPILMFVLVAFVRMPKLLDLQEPAERWADAFSASLSRRIG